MKLSENDKWAKTRAKWFKANPANHQGYYACNYCWVWVPAREVTLDHIISRSNAPQLRHDLSNLTPACAKCNADKGSLNSEQYKTRLNDRKVKAYNKLREQFNDQRAKKLEANDDN